MITILFEFTVCYFLEVPDNLLTWGTSKQVSTVNTGMTYISTIGNCRILRDYSIYVIHVSRYLPPSLPAWPSHSPAHASYQRGGEDADVIMSLPNCHRRLRRHPPHRRLVGCMWGQAPGGRPGWGAL